MTRYTGLNSYLGNVSGHQAVNVGVGSSFTMVLVGDVEDFEVLGQGELLQVPNVGNPFYGAIETARVRPELTVTYHPQNTSYLHSYLVVQTGNNLSAHHVAYYANSADYGILFNTLPQRVEVTKNLNEPLRVRATLVGTSWSRGFQTSAGNFVVSSTEPILSNASIAVQILEGGTLLRDFTTLWRRLQFIVDYKSTPQYTGTGVTPTDVLESVRDVRGLVEVSVNESAPLLTAVNGSYLNIRVGMMIAPMSSTYMFYSSIVRAVAVTVPGTNVQRQRFEWSCKYVTRSSL